MGIRVVEHKEALGRPATLKKATLPSRGGPRERHLL